SEAYAQPGAVDALAKALLTLQASAAAPAAQIGLVRRIRTLDEQNPAWLAQLGALEKQRFEQIRQALAAHWQTMTLRDAGALLEELTDSALTQPPPPALLS